MKTGRTAKRGANMLRIALCDDESYFLAQEKKIITQYMNERNYPCEIDSFGSGAQLLDHKSDFCYDILFLDVNMRGMDGIEAAKRIRQNNVSVYIVFVTAFIDYSLEGYKVNAVRYILKDSRGLEEAIYECMDTIIDSMDDVKQKRWFEFVEGKKRIQLDHIIYIESNLHKLTFHVIEQDEKIYSMYEKLDRIDELLRNSHFCRIHKSFLVNFRYVQSIERYAVTLLNGGKIPISQPRYKDVREKYIWYKGEL